jgi:RHS repeat-associated protein
MRYTLNGTTPSESNGTLIAASSGSVSVTPTTEGTTLQAIAFKAGMTDSDVYAATYYYDGGNMPQEGGTDSNQSSVTPGYDANGNLIAYKDRTYSYDAQNRLRTVKSNGTQIAEFYYDGKNRQIARNINGTIRFSAWDNWELLEKYAGGMQRTEGYLQGATGVIKTLVSNLYYYQDKLGSTTHIADGSGHWLESYHYDLYGTPTETSIHGVVDLYAGERFIPELGLYDLRNRFMSPELGRFLQADPIGFKGDASNLYRYCGNDPVDRSDPTGLIWASEGFEYVPNYISNVPNVYVTRVFNPRATGVTLQRFWIDAQIRQTANGKYVLDFRDVEIRSHSYIRTYQPQIFTTPGSNFSMRRVWATTVHEAGQQGIDRGYYPARKDAIRQDITSGTYNSENAARKDFDAKQEKWKKDLTRWRTPQGIELQNRDGFGGAWGKVDGSQGGGQSGAQNPESLGNQFAMGSTGPLAGEGFHPGGPR